jgi:hypothetical protein
MLIEASIP